MQQGVMAINKGRYVMEELDGGREENGLAGRRKGDGRREDWLRRCLDQSSGWSIGDLTHSGRRGFQGDGSDIRQSGESDSVCPRSSLPPRRASPLCFQHTTSRVRLRRRRSRR